MTEKEVLQYWQENDIFAKSLQLSDKDFVFYEGPPSANGLPGIHHMEARAFKDAVCRYKTMTGWRVLRRAGWDTQGLPIENQAAKELGLAGRKEIEAYGIAKFNQKCREIVFHYKKEWESATARYGFWLDMDDPYITYSPEYIEELWRVFAKIYNRQVNGQPLVYQDNKVVPHCPACESTLSSHEVAQGYQEVVEGAYYLKFAVREHKDTYLLVWTTTPWTLPANVACAISAKAQYVQARDAESEDILILERSVAEVLKFEIIKSISTEELLKLEYIPPFSEPSLAEHSFRVLAADFVSNAEGSGIVHIAPAFGEDDFQLAKAHELPMPLTIDSRGIITAPVPGEGKFVKLADTDLVDDLKQRGLLWRVQKIKHTYPFCWRCDGPLVYTLKPSWFIAMSQLKDEIKANNDTINWVPDYIKYGRFGNFLDDLKDWAISREKAWGTPIPIWQCADCGKTEVISDFTELEHRLGHSLDPNFDPHRPFVDELSWPCTCGATMRRISEVIDVWFDSGAMPYASGEHAAGRFPADYITEAIDQTRGWFYTLLAISTLLELGPAYKNVITLGMVVDKSGKKMSKSRGNIINPMEMMDKFSADALRWYFYTINQPAEVKRFDERDLQNIERGFLATWKNMLNYYQTYQPLAKQEGKLTLLDEWALARVKEVGSVLRTKMDSYDLVAASRELAVLADDLSNWYLRRNRKRLEKSFFDTLRSVLIDSAKMIAPFAPFIAESIYQDLSDGAQSVHFEQLPDYQLSAEETKIISKMRYLRSQVSNALALRARMKIKVRQPLASYGFPQEIELEQEYLDILAAEINVKAVNVSKKGSKPELDTTISEELAREGEIAELLRQIQVWRKAHQFQAGQSVELSIFLDDLTLSAAELNGVGEQTNCQIKILIEKPDTQAIALNHTKLYIQG